MNLLWRVRVESGIKGTVVPRNCDNIEIEKEYGVKLQ